MTSVAAAGSKATISYSGLFNGAAPTVTKKTANIKLESYLVVHE